MALLLLLRGKGNQLIPTGQATKLRNLCTLNGPHKASHHNLSHHLNCHRHTIKPHCHGASKSASSPNHVFARTFSSLRTRSTVFLRSHRCNLLSSSRKFHVTRLKSRGPGGGGGGIGSRFEVTENVTIKQSEIKRLLQLARPEKWRLTGAILLLAVSSAVTLCVPFGIGKVIDIIYSKTDDRDMTEKLENICKILAVVFVVGGLANFGRSYLMSVSGQRIVKKMREALFGSIIRQEMAFFDRTKTGELINRLSTDTSLVGQSLTMNISDGLRSTAQAIGGVSMMFVVCPKLAGVALCIVPPVVGVSIIYGRYVRKITRQVQDALADSTQVAEERLSNMRTVRAFVHEKREEGVYNGRIDKVLNLSYNEALASGVFWGFTGLSGNMVILSVFYYGGLMMNEAQITVGDLSSFMMYAAYVGVSLGGLTAFYSAMMKGLGASSRIWELTDRLPSIPLDSGLNPTAPLIGNISFKDVHFSYPTRNDVAVFSGLDLEVPAGQVLAVVGSSGSGKSTLASLLLRYYDPEEGDISIDGYPVRNLSPTWLRSNMSIVSQEPALFSSSVRDNIAYGARDPTTVTEAEIVQAAKMANAYNFIQMFPKGFDTVVGERGILLSGGQKQRIAIARAILKNPAILLLDEATSALDAESEYLVQEALERVMVGRTVIVIAHRLSTIKNANQIAVIDKGKIAELGSYENLMQIEEGLFRKLVERQTITNGP